MKIKNIKYTKRLEGLLCNEGQQPFVCKMAIDCQKINNMAIDFFAEQKRGWGL